jgi:hypothetical protein
MDGAGGRCVLALAATAYHPAEARRPRDGRTLDAGDGSRRRVHRRGRDRRRRPPARSGSTRATASSKLGRLEFDEVFEKQTAGKIARALLDAGGLSAGTVADGPSFPGYVLHRGPRALAHLQRLAEQCGVDVFTDGAGKVHFAGPDATRQAAHL